MLSVVASLTPYSDYNQSPRNMYQCQMAKQTMGTPLQALPHRTDTKLYRIQSPQTPIARTDKYNDYCMDEYPNGTNAVVGCLLPAAWGARCSPAHCPPHLCIGGGGGGAWLRCAVAAGGQRSGGPVPGLRLQTRPASVACRAPPWSFCPPPARPRCLLRFGRMPPPPTHRWLCWRTPALTWRTP
jgi:hypothetical protein